MNTLNKICSYWYDCIKREDTQEQEISINVRTKAVLYPFEEDPFIFTKRNVPLKTTDARLIEFAKRKVEDVEFFYGYPLLYYKDEATKKDLIAPLLMLKVKLETEFDGLNISKDEANPTCGTQALSKLGLRAEEIARINEEVEKLYLSNPKLDQQELADQVIALIEKETTIAWNEELQIHQLTNSTKISKNMTAGLYNKSVIFAAEEQMYNVHLIKDLMELKKKLPITLEETALSFITGTKTTEVPDTYFPVLPFPANEYQVAGLKDILANSLSVITGPPGTGKSQFITNLIINLFVANKSVLFVSHTGEAVNVVYEKLNEPFKNLMIRTGNKQSRQNLPSFLDELEKEAASQGAGDIDLKMLGSIWASMSASRDQLMERDELEKAVEEKYFRLKALRGTMADTPISWQYIKLAIKIWLLNRQFKREDEDLNLIPAKSDIENKIKEKEKEFYDKSHSYVRGVYAHKMCKAMKEHPGAREFLREVSQRKFHEDDVGGGLAARTLNSLSVWACTLKSLRATFPLSGAIFDYVIFDEASQVDLPSAAPALYRAKNAIIVGDPQQLTHIATIPYEIDKQLAHSHGLTEIEGLYPRKVGYSKTSLYQAAETSLGKSPLLLRNHYRSEDQIISLCNQVFYGGKLKILSSLEHKKIPASLPFGMEWIDVKGQTNKLPTGSRINKQEVEAVCSTLRQVLTKISRTDLSVGIVTPYSGQSNLIFREIIKIVTEEQIERHQIKVLTAHRFQGSEKDIIIFSQVLASRGDGNSDIWYNYSPQILNVALSRARYLLYIIGDQAYCESRRSGSTLHRIATAYIDIKNQQNLEENSLGAKFDSPTERIFYENMQKLNLKKYGYKLVPKLIVKRYTLDFALVGKDMKIDIELDGAQHEIVGGMPVIEDVARDEFLEKEGWQVTRIPNNIVLTEMEMVMKMILKLVKPKRKRSRK